MNILTLVLWLPMTFAACVAEVSAQDELALWSLWRHHASNSDNHAQVAAACLKFEKDAPNTPLLPVVRGLAAWHMLKLGNTNAAVKMFQSMDSPPSEAKAGASMANAPAANHALREAGMNMARTWLTRIDREQTMRSLREYYVRHAEYPATLQLVKFVPEGSAPLTDRWGLPWQYRTAGFTQLTGLQGQRYVLQSAKLGGDSNLAGALAREYAGRIDIRHIKVLSSDAGGGMLELVADRSARKGSEKAGAEDKAPSKAVVSVGKSAGDIYVAFIGVQVLVFSDNDHWLVSPRQDMQGTSSFPR